MIERKFVSQKFTEFHVKEYLKKELSRVGLSDVKLQKTSMGQKIIITANRPGLVVGRGGAVIQKLTKVMADKFKLENPQIEIEEIKNVNLDADVVAEGIVNQLERFGSQRFKGIGHKTMSRVMDSGALGVEILLSGRIPSSRAKRWRFADGYMKKCGDVAITGVNTAITYAILKTGVVGVQVKIMPNTTILPDNITVLKEPILEEIKTQDIKIPRDEKKSQPRKKSPKKTTEKKSSSDEKKSPRKKSPKKTTETVKEDKQ